MQNSTIQSRQSELPRYEINPQSTQLTQFTSFCATRQLSSLEPIISLEPMPYGIVASIDASHIRVLSGIVTFSTVP